MVELRHPLHTIISKIESRIPNVISKIFGTGVVSVEFYEIIPNFRGLARIWLLRTWLRFVRTYLYIFIKL